MTFIKKINKNNLKEFKNSLGVDASFNLSCPFKIFFILFMLIIPIIYSLICFILIKLSVVNSDNKIINNINTFVFMMIIPLSFMIYSFINLKKVMFTNKMFGYYIWTLLVPISIGGILNINGEQTLIKTIYIVFYLISGFLLIFWFFWKNTIFINMFKNLIKTKFIYFIVFVIIGILLNYFIGYMFSLIENTYSSSSTSNNQTTILEIYNIAYPFNWITLFLTVVIIAPIIEEVIYRYIIQNIFDNKAYSIVISSILFSFMHIQSSFDWENFLSYWTLGIVTGSIYWLSKNIYNTITIHAFCNLVSFIVIFINQ